MYWWSRESKISPRQVGAAFCFLSTDWSNSFHRMHLGGVHSSYTSSPMIFEVDKIRLHLVLFFHELNGYEVHRIELIIQLLRVCMACSNAAVSIVIREVGYYVKHYSLTLRILPQDHNRVKRERRHFMLSALHPVHQIHRITSTNDSTSPIMHNVILTLLDVEVDLSNNDVHSITLL